MGRRFAIASSVVLTLSLLLQTPGWSEVPVQRSSWTASQALDGRARSSHARLVAAWGQRWPEGGSPYEPVAALVGDLTVTNAQEISRDELVGPRPSEKDTEVEPDL